MSLGPSLLLLAVSGAGPASVEVPARVDAPVDVSARSSRDWKLCGPPVLLKDIALGAAGSEPRELVHGDGVLFFTADDGVHGRELWKSSGTGGAGTFLVADVRPGPLGSEPHALTVVGDRVFFIADDGVDGQQLWVSDGMARGTRKLTRLHPDLLGIFPSLIDFRGTLYFSANDGVHGFELWRSDGTPGARRRSRTSHREPRPRILEASCARAGTSSSRRMTERTVPNCGPCRSGPGTRVTEGPQVPAGTVDLECRHNETAGRRPRQPIGTRPRHQMEADRSPPSAIDRGHAPESAGRRRRS
ncbi:hypothetical protein JY651_10670 [Pyxidicoccus parkwayensis]|uniref:Uncharacterized protein n=1 Tax=Pyxidicoccus parkwayensis TaxID=2813578 RepID=A0ABX7P4J4_9BACT|nr:ELWxxDGT repeat protein [Pyxidicoccus parkwaysis]QSQ25351.1 hypothetical protein JY651_10670 [Pyxidicoccus parkwaysis]